MKKMKNLKINSKAMKTLACIFLIWLIAIILKMTVFSNIETFVEHHNTRTKTRTIKMEFEKEDDDEKKWPEGCELSDKGNVLECDYNKVINEYKNDDYPTSYFKDKDNLATHNGILYNKNFFKKDEDEAAYKYILDDDGLLQKIGGDNKENISKNCILLNSKYDDGAYTIKAMCKGDPTNTNTNIPLVMSSISDYTRTQRLNICNGTLSTNAC